MTGLGAAVVTLVFVVFMVVERVDAVCSVMVWIGSIPTTYT